MLTKVFNTGTGKAKSAINYLLGDKDSNGKTRSVKPEILSGDPKAIAKIIDGTSRKIKYTSGAIALRDNEKLNPDQIKEVINNFRKTLLPGLKVGVNFLDLWILHEDKGNIELHFIIANTELSTGKRLCIHPPGKKNLEYWRTFDKVMNEKFGFDQVVPDPLKVLLKDFETKTEAGKKDLEIKRHLPNILSKQILNGKISNRKELIQYLEKSKVEVTRVGKDYISVKLPGHEKAKRLRGELFKEDSDYKDIVKQHHASKIPKKLTPTEYVDATHKLVSFINERKEYNNILYKSVKTGFRRTAKERLKNNNPVKVKTQKEKREIKIISPQRMVAKLDEANDLSLLKIGEMSLTQNDVLKRINQVKNNICNTNSPSTNIASSSVKNLIKQIGNLSGSLTELQRKLQNASIAEAIIIHSKILVIKEKLAALNASLAKARIKERDEFERKNKFKM